MEREHPREVTLLDLSRGWESLLTLEDVSPESEYRIRKLISRGGPLADKMFLKTMKGREMMAECSEKTRLVRDQLLTRAEGLYRALTELERAYDELIRKAYEFRIKAG